MKKTSYQPPQTEVVELTQSQVLCTSTSPKGTKSMFEDDLDGSGFVEL